MAAINSDKIENPDVFEYKLPIPLKRTQDALSKKLLAAAEGSSAALKIAARIEALEEQIKQDQTRQEQAWKRVRGLLPAPKGTGPKIRVITGVNYTRKGVPHLAFQLVPGFTPSSSVPHVNPVRRLKKALGVSGRQWVKLRKEMKRNGITLEQVVGLQ